MCDLTWCDPVWFSVTKQLLEVQYCDFGVCICTAIQNFERNVTFVYWRLLNCTCTLIYAMLALYHRWASFSEDVKLWWSLCTSVFTAMSTFSPVSSWSLNGMRVCVCVREREREWVCEDGMNLKYALHWHIHISVHSVLCQCHTQAHASSNHLRILNWRG